MKLFVALMGQGIDLNDSVTIDIQPCAAGADLDEEEYCLRLDGDISFIKKTLLRYMPELHDAEVFKFERSTFLNDKLGHHYDIDVKIPERWAEG